MKKLLALAAVLVLVFSLAACNNSGDQAKDEKKEDEAKVEVMTMAGQDLVDLMADSSKSADVIVVDVRKEDEFKAGHIKGAINIALEDIEAKLSELEDYKEKTVVLYCNTGNRSGKAGAQLMEKGFKTVYNADGVKKFEYELVTE